MTGKKASVWPAQKFGVCWGDANEDSKAVQNANDKGCLIKDV